jgi:hypothetical protein
MYPLEGPQGPQGRSSGQLGRKLAQLRRGRALQSSGAKADPTCRVTAVDTWVGSGSSVEYTPYGVRAVQVSCCAWAGGRLWGTAAAKRPLRRGREQQQRPRVAWRGAQGPGRRWLPAWLLLLLCCWEPSHPC